MVLQAAIVANMVMSKIEEQYKEKAKNVRRKKGNIYRETEQMSTNVMHNYFNEHEIFQGCFFRLLFWIHKHLFQFIVEDVTNICSYFQRRPDTR